ncbi:MAG: hypothetical protein AAGE65_10125, partial [Planctomycetota bacterium]
VAQKLRTSVPELSHYLAGKNPLCGFLLYRFAEYETIELSPAGWKAKQFPGQRLAYCKEIWDVAPVAWLIDPSWCPSVLASSPRHVDAPDGSPCWSLDDGRHLIRECTDIHRDPIFGDLFKKLAGA